MGGFRCRRAAASVRWPVSGAVSFTAVSVPAVAWGQAAEPSANSGDTAWMLMSSALVLLMTPGLALFYGGMVRKKNVLATFMYSHFALALVSVQWVVIGYSLCFGTSVGGVIGGLDYVFL